VKSIAIPALAAIALAMPGPSSAITLLAGFEDDFADGSDPAYPSPELVAVLAEFGGCQDLDLVAGEGQGQKDRQVAHTFSHLPSGITGATLEFRVRAGAVGGIENDGIFLTFVEPSTWEYTNAILWRRSFGPIPVTPPFYPLADPGLLPEWSNGTEATITLDLGALPVADGSTLNLLPLMSYHGFLDVNVSDETGCDYFRLTYTSDSPTAAPATAGSSPVGLRCFPNPCRDAGTIRFTLDRPGPARLGVYDVAGRLVREFADPDRGAGEQRLDWRTVDGSGRALPPGTYFVRLATPDRVESRKVVVIR
jgi:hypothetical protein